MAAEVVRQVAEVEAARHARGVELLQMYYNRLAKAPWRMRWRHAFAKAPLRLFNIHKFNIIVKNNIIVIIVKMPHRRETPAPEVRVRRLRELSLQGAS